MRSVTTFACSGETLFGTLDAAPGKTGLLIVSGGNEIRIGAHRGMAILAQKLAARGIPVFRFDRRGIGDSTGKNSGFLLSGSDIGCAAATFSAEAGIERLVAFGNCDAATALALFGPAAGIDRLILANPWVVDDHDVMPPAAAIRARYAEKLKDPREWVRLLRGNVDIPKLASGLRKLAKKPSEVVEGLAARFGTALRTHSTDTTILLADRDNTAIAFRAAWARPEFQALRARIPVVTCDTASHSFAGLSDAAWLEAQIIAAVTRE